MELTAKNDFFMLYNCIYACKLCNIPDKTSWASQIDALLVKTGLQFTRDPFVDGQQL